LTNEHYIHCVNQIANICHISIKEVILLLNLILAKKGLVSESFNRTSLLGNEFAKGFKEMSERTEFLPVPKRNAFSLSKEGGNDLLKGWSERESRLMAPHPQIAGNLCEEISLRGLFYDLTIHYVDVLIFSCVFILFLFVF
jgi:hypothetical protein